MTRNLMIALGVVLWGTFAVAATSLYLIGHWIAPTVTLMVGVPLMAFRLMQRRSHEEGLGSPGTEWIAEHGQQR